MREALVHTFSFRLLHHIYRATNELMTTFAHHPLGCPSRERKPQVYDASLWGPRCTVIVESQVGRSIGGKPLRAAYTLGPKIIVPAEKCDIIHCVAWLWGVSMEGASPALAVASDLRSNCWAVCCSGLYSQKWRIMYGRKELSGGNSKSLLRMGCTDNHVI